MGKKTVLYLMALAVFGVLLYITALSRQGNENTLVDYTYVYRDAMNLATGGKLEYTDYFVTYSNQCFYFPYGFGWRSYLEFLRFISYCCEMYCWYCWWYGHADI